MTSQSPRAVVGGNPVPLERVLGAQHETARRFREMIDALPAAIYTTDAKGRITHFNRAVIELSGRTPELGTDQWCVTWKLYRADGTALPHDECPMAVALKEGRPVRGEEIIAERPDGTRAWIQPYPTPLYDDAGKIVGGINMLLDITGRKRAEEDQARLAAIVESSEDAIISKTLDGIVTSWNRGAEKLFGYSPSEAIGQPITLIIPPDRSDEEEMILERIRRGKPVEHYETVRLTKHGQKLNISVSISPVFEASGRIIGASKIARDITVRKRTEEALRESEERFRTMADRAPVLIWLIGSTGCEFVNRSYLDFLGVSIEDVRGMGWTKYVHPDDYENCVGGFLAASEKRALFEGEFRFRRADGVYRWMKTVGAPRLSPVGEFLGYIGSTYDITEVKEAGETLRDADRRKDEFIATLAHELRNPLAPVRNAVELLRLKGSDAPEIRWCRDVIDRQVSHLTRLIDDLLDSSRIARNRLELRKERVELAEVVKAAVETSRPLMEQFGHKLTLTLPPEPVYLHADLVRLAQVFMNLLTNAAKYTERGGKIWLTAEPEEREVVVRVKDTGIGIPPEKLPSLFNLFFQVDNSLERSRGGLGIGLTLVRRLVELHGGSVKGKSAGLGKGSEFIVRLPTVAGPEAAERKSGGGKAEAVAAGAGHRILVVDDNEDSVASLQMVLQSGGHEVHMALDGLAAIEAAQKVEPSVVLLDIGMSKLNGYEAALRIRQLQGGKDMLLIALTGWGQEEDRRRSQQVGFDHHLVKPVDHSVLMELLAEFPRKSKA